MRMFKKHNEALASVLDPEELKLVKEVVSDATVRGWSVFDHDGVEIASESVSETVTAVCSNAIDLAAKIGAELNESDERPTLTFMKGVREMHTETFTKANIIVLRDKTSGASREAHNGR